MSSVRKPSPNARCDLVSIDGTDLVQLDQLSHSSAEASHIFTVYADPQRIASSLNAPHEVLGAN
jgi:hypothetical protein